MMPYFLSQRNPAIREMMDDPACDRKELYQTYQNFRWLNRLLAGWYSIYKYYIRPHLNSHTPATLLDVGCGGGDVPEYLVKWALRDGLQLNIMGIDTDERAITFAHNKRKSKAIRFACAHTSELVEAGRTFDFVISNHLMHHLTDSALISLCRDAELLARHSVVFNDIRRSDLGYGLYYLLSCLMPRNSFVHIDGLLSIKRSFSPAELRALVPDNWHVEKPYPFRLLAYCNVKE